jgi:HD-GYP domain-containing protein (c-di-GMP phosphodiesterase class II)
VTAVAVAIVNGRKDAKSNFRAACEVADVLARRLGVDAAVRNALRTNFERWNGRGVPSGVKGTAIPRPMRIAQVAQELEVLARLRGIDDAVAEIARRRGKAYDPQLADMVVAQGAAWWSELEQADPWDCALAAAPPEAALSEGEIHECLLVLADFADLKSPWTNGHSRAVAELAVAAGGTGLRGPALLHDLGRVAVPNSVWDKAGALTRDERDMAESHSLVTDQLLRRVAFTALLASTAGAAHERVDASGYHRRVGGSQLDMGQRLLAAADCYQAMVSSRPHRPALAATAAAAELRAMAGRGTLDAEAVEQVLAAAGHRRASRPALPAGLTPREAEVLRLVALGCTVRQIAADLRISPKTVDHHVQHVYGKIGVSTRGAAALFAIENGILPTDS